MSSIRPLVVAMVALLVLPAAARAAAKPDADLVLLNGRIVTLDAAKPEVQALAARAGRIVALGSDAEVRRLVGRGTKVVDLGGKLAVPGFIEGHGHFMGLGASLRSLDLSHARNWEEIVGIVAEAAKHAKPGEWIVGSGWHQEKWSHAPEPNVDGFPLHATLDAVSPNNPVALRHASGHGVYANAAALALAGVTRESKDPAGGVIVRDAKGEPAGMLRDTAMDLVLRAFGSWLAARPAAEVEATAREVARLAAQDAVSKGVTTFVDQGEGFATLDFLKRLAGERALPLRLYAMVDATRVDPLLTTLPGADRYSKLDQVAQLERFLAPHRVVDFADGRFTVRAVGEVTADGALGTHTAWFLSPYADLADNTGVSVTPPGEIRRIAEACIANGYQVATHAIGDRAIREVLDVYQAAFAAHPNAKDLRWRVEHVQHADPADIPRFGKMGVIASMQSVHACSDGPYVARRLGPDRAKRESYAWRSLMDTGALIANGTDTPVENVDPIANFFCAVSRQLADGSTFNPEQVMTRAEALKSYTWNDAYAIFSEKEIGSLKVGMRADVAVTSKDILTVPVDEIPSAKVVYTIVGGEVVYTRP